MAKLKKRKRPEAPGVKLEMTPMIDVVFQLLAFFVVTFEIQDILSHLDVSRPAPDPNAKPEEQVEDLLTVLVYDQGFVLQGKKVTINEMDRQLSRLGQISSDISIVIKCTSNSPHGYLVQLLDVCAKAGLRNLSVFSM